ncbi:MAG: prepilin-type N-terminal cleavage/methylation domain-containing protein [bacterium]
MKKFFLQFIKNSKQKAFTLVELLVVIAIFTLITTVALFDQGKLSSSVLLSNLAYDVALSAREAQTYGVGAKYVASAGGVQGGGYGIYFDVLNPEGVIIFHDVNDNGVYELTDEIVKQYKFTNQRGNKLTKLCQGSDPNSPCLTTASQLSVVYKRPNPEPTFISNISSPAGPVYAIFQSQDGKNCRAVVMESSGQIRVETSLSKACPVNPNP